MDNQLQVLTEEIDDIPVLLAQMERMGIARFINKHIPTHGNWQGLTPGQLSTTWLSHILSQGDHRLNGVEPWAAQHPQLLQQCVDPQARALDFSDDRLAWLLTHLGEASVWQAIERDLTQTLLRVYDLSPQSVRLDSTTSYGYWTVTPEGLFQLGTSKDHRPDLPQVKVMLATLDALGLPLATMVVGGQRADDRLYIPAIDHVRQGTGKRGLLYVGDVKLVAQRTRAYLEHGHDYYLGPLSQRQLPPAGLTDYLKPVWEGNQPLTYVYRPGPDGEPQLIAKGYESPHSMAAKIGGQMVRWEERRLIICSIAQQEAQQAALETRLAQALKDLAALNVYKQGKRRPTEIPPVQAKAEAVLKRRKVDGLLDITYELGTVTTPKGTVLPMVQITATRNETVIFEHSRLLGWRVYVTNHPVAGLSLEQAVWTYREQYTIEHNFGRLKGQPLSLQPTYLADEQRVSGLIHLLSLGLRVLTLIEFTVRQQLAATATTLAGLYAGNRKRATARPTAERLLAAFNPIHLSQVILNDEVHYYLSPLSELQQKILNLLGFSESPYKALLQLSARPVIADAEAALC